ncbi:hypothetical protein MKX01_037541 [Papaver californicum]|nr:hypothetical protein MKX01_037541 [Papaver californicum]
MIKEARARKSDPVYGLPGIAETLSQQLNNLTSELAFVNQQNQFHRRHSVVLQQEQRQFQSYEAKGVSSSPPRAVPSHSLEEIGSTLTVSLSLCQMY